MVTKTDIQHSQQNHSILYKRREKNVQNIIIILGLCVEINAPFGIIHANSKVYSPSKSYRHLNLYKFRVCRSQFINDIGMNIYAIEMTLRARKSGRVNPQNNSSSRYQYALSQNIKMTNKSLFIRRFLELIQLRILSPSFHFLGCIQEISLC